MAKPIGTLGTIQTLTIGGMAYTDLTTLITTLGYAGAGTYGTVRLPTASAGYQVTSGKTYTITAMTEAGSDSADRNGTVGYANTDAGFAAGAPTTPVYIFGSIAVKTVYSSNTGTSPRNPVSHPNFGVPATKYPFIYSNTGSMFVFCYGYET